MPELPPVVLVHGPQSPAIAACESLGDRVQLQRIPASELTRLPPQVPALVELGALSAEQRTQLFESRPDGKGLVVLGGAELAAELPDLFDTHRLHHLLRCDTAIDGRDLKATLEQLTGPRRFGVQAWLDTPVKTARFELNRASARNEVVGEASRFAQSVEVGSRYATGFSTIADELLSNAVYNAPTDSRGAPRYAHLARDVEVQLEPNEAVTCELAFDGKRLAISVTDSFGAIGLRHLQLGLARCLRKGQDQVSYKPGGAGLGLFYTLQMVSHLVFNVQPKAKTEVLGLIDTGTGFREFAARPKSFNWF
jgi:hypothetical protein